MAWLKDGGLGSTLSTVNILFGNLKYLKHLGWRDHVLLCNSLGWPATYHVD